MGPLRSRATNAGPLVAAVVGAAILSLAVAIFINSRGFGYDYAAYDAAARRIVEGGPLYVPGTAEAYAAGAYEGLYLYPAPLAIALTPLTLFDPAGAAFVWMALRIGLLVVGCAVLPVSRSWRLATFAVACVSFPVLFDLNIGNISIVVFALSALGWRMADRPIGAVAHAALIAMRFPFGLYFVQWLAQGRIRTIVWTIAAGLVLIAVSLPIVGVGTYLDYVTILRSLPDISTGEHNLSLRTTLLAAGVSDGLASLAIPVTYLVGLAGTMFAARRRDADVAFVATTTATMLVTPFIHPHYLVLLLLPAALLAAHGRPWALALPLLGWLPDPVLPLVAPITLGLVLFTTSRPAPEGA